MTIKGILLDLDGVITETSEYHFEAWRKLALGIDINIDWEFNECLKGVSRMDSLDLILQYGNSINKYSQKEKEALAERKNKHYVELLQNLTPEDILPGIRTFLKEARANGIKTGIASASKNAQFIINAIELEVAIDFIADISTVKHSKPYPDIFIAASKGISIQPEFCIGIEDAAAGIKAINAAGMKSIGIGKEAVLREADLVIRNTSELNFNNIVTYFENH